MDTKLLLGCLLVWLLCETIQDIFSRDIPRWFSIIPIVLGSAYQIYSGNFLVAVLVLVSILATNLSNRQIRMAFVILPALVIAFTPGFLPLAVGWLLFYLGWEYSILGGADALAGAYLLFWFPTWAMFAMIVAGILVWHIGALLFKYGRNAFLRLWSIVEVGAESTRVPGIGSFFIAVVLFIGYLSFIP